MEYVRGRLPEPDGGVAAQVGRLITDFASDEFDTRQAVTGELVKIGAPVLAAVRVAANSPSDEVRYRAERVLQRLGPAGQGSGDGSAGRSVRVLERAAGWPPAIC